MTGAGGSIGSELCRQISRCRPDQLILLGKGENSVYAIQNELASRYRDVDVVSVIGDIASPSKIDHVFKRYRPAVVFHAAAHKHVPFMEDNPEESVLNNIFGTRNVAEAAVRHGCDRFVMVSSDKAVNPTSVMGATKRVAELVLQGMASAGDTHFITVRFGNVLRSRGSVIPLFEKQIAAGGPVTVTHPEMKRYFMSIPEAVRLVLHSGAIGHSGDLCILDMGEQVRIVDLAENMIRMNRQGAVRRGRHPVHRHPRRREAVRGAVYRGGSADAAQGREDLREPAGLRRLRAAGGGAAGFAGGGVGLQEGPDRRVAAADCAVVLPDLARPPGCRPAPPGPGGGGAPCPRPPWVMDPTARHPGRHWGLAALNRPIEALLILGLRTFVYS